MSPHGLESAQTWLKNAGFHGTRGEAGWKKLLTSRDHKVVDQEANNHDLGQRRSYTGPLIANKDDRIIAWTIKLQGLANSTRIAPTENLIETIVTLANFRCLVRRRVVCSYNRATKSCVSQRK